MDSVLTSLFANTGLSGAVLASLLGIIYVLLKDRRTEHTEWMQVQKDLSKALMELSAVIHEFQGMNRH